MKEHPLTVENVSKHLTVRGNFYVKRVVIFEVAVDKVENFDKKAKEHSGKHLLQDRLKKHNKGDVEWDLKK